MIKNISNNNKQFYFKNNFLLNKTNHRIVRFENDGTVILKGYKGTPVVVGPLSWILTDGIWNDAGEWKDTDFYEDYALNRNVMLLDGASDFYIPNTKTIDSYEIGLDFFHNSLQSKCLVVKGLKTSNEGNNELQISTYATGTKEECYLNITIGGTFSGTTQITPFFLNQDNWNRLVLTVFKKSSTVYSVKIVLNDVIALNQDLTVAGYVNTTKDFEFFTASGTFGRFNNKVANLYFKDLNKNKTYTFDLTGITANEIKSIEDTSVKLTKTAGNPTFNNETNYFYGIDKKPDSENVSYTEPDNRYILNPWVSSTQYSVPTVAKEYFNPNRYYKIEFDMFVDLYAYSSSYTYSLIAKTATITLNPGWYKELFIYFNTISSLRFAINTPNSYQQDIQVLEKLYIGEWNHYSIEIEYKTSTTVELKLYVNDQFVYQGTFTKNALTIENNNFNFSCPFVSSYSSSIQPLKNNIANVKLYDFDKTLEADKFRMDENSTYFYSDNSYKKRISSKSVGTVSNTLVSNPFKPKTDKAPVVLEPQYRNVAKLAGTDGTRLTLNKEFFDLNNNFKISGMFYLKDTPKTQMMLLQTQNLGYMFSLYKNLTDFTMYYQGTSKVLTYGKFISGAWNSFSIEITKITATTSTVNAVINGYSFTYTITHNNTDTYKQTNLIIGAEQNSGTAFDDKLMNFVFEDKTNNKKLTFRLDENDNVSSYRCPENPKAKIYKTWVSSTLVTTENILNPLFV